MHPNVTNSEHSGADSGHSGRSEGQSLIETIVAIFVLTTGLSSGLALAIFAFGSSSDISEKIVGTGLSREGIESVRRMRDSNWLSGTLTDCGDGQQCYATWLSSPYNMVGTSGNGLEYRPSFNPSSQTNKWTLIPSGPGSDFRLYVQPSGGLSHTPTSEPINFFRKINIIYQETTGEYSAISPLVLVRSVVWWHERNCPNITYLSNLSDTRCKIVTEEYLTNWRNY